MTFFELREAALSGAALSGAALSGAALSIAAAVVAEAEERQGEEEQYERFAYRHHNLSDTTTCRIVIAPGIRHHQIIAPIHHPLTKLIRRVNQHGGGLEPDGRPGGRTGSAARRRIGPARRSAGESAPIEGGVHGWRRAMERLIAPRSGRRCPVIGRRDGLRVARATQQP